MNRRRYLALLGAGSLATLAGCIGDDDDDPDDEPDDDPDDEPDDDPDDEPDDDPPSNYQISADVPNVVETGEELTYSVTVSNAGEGDGVALFGLDLVGEDGDTEPVFEDEIVVDPGESETVESDPFTLDEALPVTFEFYVSGPDNSDTFQSELEVVTPERDWGEPFETPEGMVVTAAEPEFTDRYTYEDFGGDEQVAEAEPGNMFVFIEVVVENESGETRAAPNILSFELIADGQVWEPLRALEYERDDRYDGLTDLPAGTREEGVLPYEVPEDDDVELFYNDTTDEFESFEVTWGP